MYHHKLKSVRKVVLEPSKRLVHNAKTRESHDDFVMWDRIKCFGKV